MHLFWQYCRGGVHFIGNCPTVCHEYSPVWLPAWLPTCLPSNPARLHALKTLNRCPESRDLFATTGAGHLLSVWDVSETFEPLCCIPLRATRCEGARVRWGPGRWVLVGAPKYLKNNGLDIWRVRQDTSYFGGRDFTWVWNSKTLVRRELGVCKGSRHV